MVHAATRDGRHRERIMMKTPVGLVTVALTVAILLAASLLIVTGTRGQGRDAPVRLLPYAKKTGVPPGRVITER